MGISLETPKKAADSPKAGASKPLAGPPNADSVAERKRAVIEAALARSRAQRDKKIEEPIRPHGQADFDLPEAAPLKEA